METKQQLFHLYPNKHPKTGDSIIIGSDEYIKLTNKYGNPPKIKSPKTGAKITIGKGEYNKLIREAGYTEKELLSSINMNEKVKSPVTKRMINKNGKTYKQLIEKGYFKEQSHTKLEDVSSHLLKIPIDDLINLYKVNKYYNELLNSKLYLDQLSLYYNLTPSLTFNEFVNKYNILHYYNIILDTILTKENEIYKNSIYVVLLNIVLILMKARPAYILDIRNEKLENILIPLIFKYFNNLSIIGKGERMIFLTENKDYIEKEYHKGNISYSYLLGYCYHNIDFMDLTLDRLSIIPTASNQDMNVQLYITVIPKYAYKDDIKKCVEDQIKLFDSILINFGFNIVLTKNLTKGKKNVNNYWYEQNKKILDEQNKKYINKTY